METKPTASHSYFTIIGIIDVIMDMIEVDPNEKSNVKNHLLGAIVLGVSTKAIENKSILEAVKKATSDSVENDQLANNLEAFYKEISEADTSNINPDKIMFESANKVLSGFINDTSSESEDLLKFINKVLPIS